MRTASDTDLSGKNVLLRTDLNLPIIDGEIQSDLRFEQYLQTIQQLSAGGARLFVLAHQGRPGREDFTSLQDHADLLGQELDQDVELVESFFGQELQEAVRDSSNGDVYLIENIRMMSEETINQRPEEHAEAVYIRKLVSHFDAFVNDAFSAAHRPHASMVGCMPHLDTYAGPVMEDEIANCTRARDRVENPLLVLGGEKTADIVTMLQQMIERADKVLLGGIPGEIALHLQGHDLGGKWDWIVEKGLDESVGEFKELLEKHTDKFVLPEDVQTDSGTHSVDSIPADEIIWDIGPETASNFSEHIKDAESVIMKGPLGAYDRGHDQGTDTVLQVVKDCQGYSLLGGGDTSGLVTSLGYSIDDFSHVSIAGGAFVRFMSGEDLPVIQALEQYS